LSIITYVLRPLINQSQYLNQLVAYTCIRIIMTEYDNHLNQHTFPTRRSSDLLRRRTASASPTGRRSRRAPRCARSSPPLRCCAHPDPKSCPSRSRFPRPRRLRRSRWRRAPGSRALRAPIAWIVLLIRALLRAACGRGREPEQPALGRNVRFRLLDLHADALARAFRSRLHRERDVDPGHLLVVTVVDDGLVGHPVLDAPVDGADLEEVIGVEVDVGHIAVRTRDAQLVRLGAVDVLGAQVIERVALGLVVDEHPGEVG